MPLLDDVLALADDDSATPDETKYLVIAAMEGDEELADAVGERYIPPEARPAEAPAATKPTGAYLRSVTVSGFRGVGPERTLELHPAPGLTVVAGRNGSGKSSFAEALEVGLTRTSYRWEERPKGWVLNWDNLHVDGPRRIRIGLAEEAVGSTVVGVDWPADATRFDALQSWVQRGGERRQGGLDGLGWTAAIHLYRPIVSHEELGGLLAAPPKRLYEALTSILGLEEIAAAQTRLDRLRAETAARPDAARTEATALKRALADCDDERATEAARLLRKHTHDLVALRALAIGATGTPPRALSQLRALIDIVVPEREAVEAAAKSLRDAVGALAELAGDLSDRATQQFIVLRQAVELHDQHGGDQPCPVCGIGELDKEWRSSAEAALAARADDERILGDARRDLQRARDAIRALVGGVSCPTEPDDVVLTSVGSATEAWSAWTAAPADDLQLADHVMREYGRLQSSVAAIHAEAAAEWAARQDAWAPYATRLGTWVDNAEAAQADEPKAATAKAAFEWLKAHAEIIRNRRLAPLADDARRIWAALRQESNVDLKAITLPAPRGNTRQVSIEAEVDGSDAGALGVMSTGELHALALALFLPRATRPESPFRFVVLDDPVQAMDPSKIDGLVRVLAELAQTRQVVVFSHDDRLPEAVRRLVADARVVEVTRGIGSVVEIQELSDPAERDLQDARAFVRDDAVPDDLLRRVVPRLCRSAVETAARDAWFARAFDAGSTRQQVEAAWESARNQPSRIALALHGDSGRSVKRWLDSPSYRKIAVEVCGGGNHRALTADPKYAVECVGKLVGDLRSRS
ncbi:AAA family ATPase [Pseudonocardia oroxyli]|nr:AAA family ATPase [Pseudonocardia oroxyli]